MSRQLKPVEAADREAELRAEEADARGHAWWSRVPKVVTAPRAVFDALAETDDLDVDARSEPVLAITILAGIAGVLLSPAWGTIMDDGSVDVLVVVVVTFVAGLLYGAVGYFLLGLVVWLGAKAVGVDTPFRIARQLVGLSALPLALSLVVLVPAIAIAFGEDWFHSGGADEGTGEALLIGIGLAFATWSVALVALGLRTTFRLPWRGVVGALALAAVIVAALYVLPELPERLPAGTALISAPF
jgi:Yip1 domain